MAPPTDQAVHTVSPTSLPTAFGTMPAASITVPVPSPAKPTFDELCDLLQSRGYTPGQVSAAMWTFRAAADAIDVESGTSNYISVNMAGHDILDDVMPDMQRSTPGSLHHVVERHFLPEGWRFVHDRHGFCSLQAVKD